MATSSRSVPMPERSAGSPIRYSPNLDWIIGSRSRSERCRAETDRRCFCRSLLAKARVLILDDPTVGVDVGARHEIHSLLDRFAAEGRAVIVAVSEPAELVSLADRVLVLGRGEVVAHLTGSDINSEELVRAVTTSSADRVTALEV